MTNLADHLFHQAATRGDKVALRFEDRSFTFTQIADEVRQAGGALAAVGVGIGARVGLLMTSRPEFVFFQQAVLALGATISPLNIFYRPNEVMHAIESCGLDYLIVGDELLDRAPPSCTTRLEPLKAIIAVPGSPETAGSRTVSATQLISATRPIDSTTQVDLGSVAMMLATSATTGKSKGVMLTLANIKANYDRTPEWLGLTSNTVTLCALPLYNTFGLNQCINALMLTGGSLVLLPRFDAFICLQMIERYRCTFLPAVPTMLQKILDHPDASKHDLGSIDRIMTGGAPVPATLLERIRSLTGPKTVVMSGYGLTEATAIVSIDHVELGADGRVLRPKSIGKPLGDIQLRIVTQEGREASCGEVGEICVRGPNVMLGYFAMPEHSAAALAGGWLHTGDLGYFDADGFGYIVDRKKDVIIRGGQNVYPLDIEEAIYQIVGVSEVAVVRKTDPVLGEVPVAFVATQPGVSLTSEALIAHCKAELAYFKVPAAVYFLPELPKGPTGKILRRNLPVPT